MAEYEKLNFFGVHSSICSSIASSPESLHCFLSARLTATSSVLKIGIFRHEWMPPLAMCLVLSRKSFLPRRILPVIFGSAKEQMSRIDTDWIVAMVAAIQFRWDRFFVCKLPRQSVSPTLFLCRNGKNWST